MSNGESHASPSGGHMSNGRACPSRNERWRSRCTEPLSTWRSTRALSTRIASAGYRASALARIERMTTVTAIRAHPARDSRTGPTRPRTAFVLSGGASLGALQAGMLHALYEHGIAPDLLVG